MKKIVLTTILSILISVLAQSQSIKIVEPEFTPAVVYVNDSVGSGLALERQKAIMKSSASASIYITGVGKVKVKYVVNYLKSTVRITDKTLRFVVNTGSNTMDPTTLVNIYALKQERGKRTLLTGQSGTFTGTNTQMTSSLTFSYKKYGNSSYLIELKDLPKGEYGIQLFSTESFHLFGVD